IKGFREMGFLPEAFVNLLAVLGWNDGTEQEIFNLDELIAKFSVERISKAGAKFDFEKAKWFNHEWIKQTDDVQLLPQIEALLLQNGITPPAPDYIAGVLSLVKERLTFVEGFWEQASFFFRMPDTYEVSAVKPKWNDDKAAFFQNIARDFNVLEKWTAEALGLFFKGKIAESGMKIGELMMPFRIMLVGGKFGPDVFQIAETLGREEVVKRIENALPHF